MTDTSQSPLVERATTTLVRHLTSPDEAGWRRVRDGFAALFAQASHVAAAELERSRTETATDPALVAEAAGEWKPKLRRLLRDNPQAAARLRALVDEHGPHIPRGSVSSQIVGEVSGTAVQAHTIHGGVNQTRFDGDHVTSPTARSRVRSSVRRWSTTTRAPVWTSLRLGRGGM
ncbi:hypothetical protein BJF83_24295 [Nocardiopsis sp. CNR-923]|uniref:hypothetical protein n=1 Tax=Nocardiopsis sp. CNR-923 TaxID=1904965 RepID=UPI00095F6EB4|nr:hypothetical protein [Nocardiopsis sp. CNR-923]OLT24338.1 hypothetical protein BJF83_24295 [Nocardiopsis sp. CNR-923]